MEASGDIRARAALRERLGAGARYDSATAPARELLWARRGTAYFARKLNELTDAELVAPSLVPGWERRHVIAHVGYHARALTRIVEAARLGSTTEAMPDQDGQMEDVDFGATLPAHALRYLFKHSEVHLNVEWRDLSDEAWNASVRTSDGTSSLVRDTPLIRAREIWIRALDLDSGGSRLDLPQEIRAALGGA